MAKFTMLDLWRPSGTVDRGIYAWVGVVAFAIKHNLDRLVAALLFHRPWNFFNYWEPLGKARLGTLTSEDRAFLVTMAALALPFIWMGVVLTLKRLRSIGLPSSLIVFFFVPFLNLLFFLVLCVLPRRDSGKKVRESSPSLDKLIPGSALGSAALSLTITVPLGLMTALLGIRGLTTYGWGIFIALPFTMGFTASLIYGYRQPRTIWGCIGVASLSVALLGAAFLAMAVEGMICIAMAAPIALPLAAFGGVFGYLIQRGRWLTQATPAALSVALLFVPGIEWMEHATAPPPLTFVVRSSLDIQASPEKVWHEVIAFSQIPPPTEWIFRTGIAYPIRAEMLGSGVGAERHCVFSTGAFVEPIEVWDEPRLLKFSVTANPAPMEEWTPYPHIDPPHLHGFLVSNGGQFRLSPLPNGGTRLEGTTWYHHGLWPAQYWRMWSDEIIHRIHMRVLRHIRDEVERQGQGS